MDFEFTLAKQSQEVLGKVNTTVDGLYAYELGIIIRDMYISIGYDADTLNDKRSWFQRCVDVCFIKQKHYTEYL